MGRGGRGRGSAQAQAQAQAGRGQVVAAVAALPAPAPAVAFAGNSRYMAAIEADVKTVLENFPELKTDDPLDADGAAKFSVDQLLSCFTGQDRPQNRG